MWIYFKNSTNIRNSNFFQPYCTIVYFHSLFFQCWCVRKPAFVYGRSSPFVQISHKGQREITSVAPEGRNAFSCVVSMYCCVARRQLLHNVRRIKQLGLGIWQQIQRPNCLLKAALHDFESYMLESQQWRTCMVFRIIMKWLLCLMSSFMHLKVVRGLETCWTGWQNSYDEEWSRGSTDYRPGRY